MGTAVFWGMLVATALGVFIIPGNFAFVEGLGRRHRRAKGAARAPVARAAHAALREEAPVKRSAGSGADPALLWPRARWAPTTAGRTVDAPADFPRARSHGAAEPGSLGDLAWWTIFQDEALQPLIQTALTRELRPPARR